MYEIQVTLARWQCAPGTSIPFAGFADYQYMHFETVRALDMYTARLDAAGIKWRYGRRTKEVLGR